ncbi:MAG TPA: thioredoxin family protein [Caulobacteraceae bacterium]
MHSFLRNLAAALAGVLALTGAARAQAVDTGHIQAELVSQEAAVAPGAVAWLAVRQKIDKGWHTYWRNAGDAGEGTKLAWTLPPGWKAGDIVWPAPKRLLEGKPPVQLAVYAYEGEVLLPVPVEVPADARPGATAQIKVAAAFLVCADICVPEDAVLTLALPVAAEPKPNPRWNEAIAATLAAAPKPAGLTATFRQEGDKVRLAITGAPLKGADMAGAYFFPFSGKVISHRDPQLVERGPEGLTLALTPGYDFEQGTPPAELSGVLALEGRAYEVTATPGPPPPGASGLGPPTAPAGRQGLPLTLLFAFVGGLILNLMPCVFPILSMKAAALAGHAHEARGARMQGMAFLTGVLVTFVALAGALIAAKAAGAAVGWGFQLQSPAVVAALALIMLLVALNLSGVFEVGTSIQGFGGGLASRQGLAGAFFTGALTVVVAAPCTAPFMASAIGVALTRSAPEALLVFAFLGLGLALPFVALSFAPSLFRKLPPPGPWMATLRRALAFPMYAAVAWLVWVLSRQGGDTGLARLLAAGLAVAIAAWLFGLGQRRSDSRARFTLMSLAALGVVAAFVVVTVPPYARPAETAELAGEAWSPERVARLRAEGRPVLVNFTAAWCITCQVNERAALATKEAADAFAATGAVYLTADWTNRDAAIAQALAEHGRAGVPLYLVYPAGGGEPKSLPQLLTSGMVAQALREAANG